MIGSVAEEDAVRSRSVDGVHVEGGMIFPTFEWVDTDGRFKLAIMPHPDPTQLDAHLRELKERGADVLVSMMQPQEAAALGLGEEGEACGRAGIDFRNHPVQDHQTPPDREEAIVFARELLALAETGSGVVIHCYAGIGRSATMAATVMLLSGFSLEEACRRISQARRLRTPETPAQLQWLAEVTTTQ